MGLRKESPFWLLIPPLRLQSFLLVSYSHDKRNKRDILGVRRCYLGQMSGHVGPRGIPLGFLYRMCPLITLLPRVKLFTTNSYNGLLNEEEDCIWRFSEPFQTLVRLLYRLQVAFLESLGQHTNKGLKQDVIMVLSQNLSDVCKLN